MRVIKESHLIVHCVADSDDVHGQDGRVAMFPSQSVHKSDGEGGLGLLDTKMREHRLQGPYCSPRSTPPVEHRATISVSLRYIPTQRASKGLMKLFNRLAFSHLDTNNQLVPWAGTARRIRTTPTNCNGAIAIEHTGKIRRQFWSNNKGLGGHTKYRWHRYIAPYFTWTLLLLFALASEGQAGYDYTDPPSVMMTAASGSTPTIDWSKGRFQSITLTAATATFTFIPPLVHGELSLLVIQDATGLRVPVFPSTVKCAAGVCTAATTTANKGTLYQFYYDGTTYWSTVISLNL